jgi:predicted RNase H-like HicB family nuclease
MNSYTVVLTANADGHYSAIVTALPGCVAQGPTQQEALENARAAIRDHLRIPESEAPPVEVAPRHTLTVPLELYNVFAEDYRHAVIEQIATDMLEEYRDDIRISLEVLARRRQRLEMSLLDDAIPWQQVHRELKAVTQAEWGIAEEEGEWILMPKAEATQWKALRGVKGSVPHKP